MTSATEFPLRPYSQDWPGINSTGGKTMRSGGEMSTCTNVQINRGDTLEKRKGFVRALDEQFAGVVCGLFIYADDCGREWLLVADEEGISIRQPFQLRDVQTLDCYPNDGFDDAALDPAFWRNTGRYLTSASAMRLASAQQETNLVQGINNATRWFKEACSTSYSVQLQFSFDVANPSRIIAVVRGNSDLTAGGLILAELVYVPIGLNNYELRIIHRRSDLVEVEIGAVDFAATPTTGFMTLAYDATQRVASVSLTVTGASQEIQSTALTSLEDVNLGLVSAIGIGQTGTVLPSTNLLQVIGASV